MLAHLLFSSAFRVVTLRLLLLSTLALLAFSISLGIRLGASLLVPIGCTVWIILHHSVVLFPIKIRSWVDLGIVMLESVGMTYLAYDAQIFHELIPIPLIPALLLGLSAAFRIAGIYKSKESFWRQQFHMFEGCPEAYPRYRVLSIFLGRSVARPLVRGESFFIIVLRALFIGGFMLGLPAISVYFVVIVPNQTMVYTQTVASYDTGGFSQSVPRIYLLNSNGTSMAADIQVSAMLYDLPQTPSWGMRILKCNTTNDQAHYECPAMWFQISTVSISFPSLDGPLDIYIQAGDDFDLGKGSTSDRSTAYGLADPIPVLPGSNLFGYLSWTERQVITSTAFFTYVTRKSAFIPRIYGLQPNSTATDNPSSGQLTLKQRPGMQVLQDTISNTAFSGIATVGGFWTSANGAFALLFGANVIYFAFGRRPLSALGVVHIFQRNSLKRQWNEDFPALRTEGGVPGSEAAGIVAFIRERLVDVGEHPPDSVTGDADQEDSELLQGQNDGTPAGPGVEAQVGLQDKESNGPGYLLDVV
ncbi:hypothetical protein FB45DRAFT_1138332 [Roridomyces roridus]|uniref:Transmembrane protein n=1 Tax=Roridomyces roridus TaxID=1738132 RepID=A0AAD7C1E7_9AGAR|nr:hypothetical protein FB45DRAFT_1138332 [Roridomyces roridus]